VIIQLQSALADYLRNAILGGIARLTGAGAERRVARGASRRARATRRILLRLGIDNADVDAP